ncbi:15_t:CDS:2, partial [Cetraspora pellucida]
MVISMDSHSKCSICSPCLTPPDYVVRSRSGQISSSNATSMQSVNNTGNNNNNLNCDYKNYITQEWVSNNRINSHEQFSFDRASSLENLDISSICPKELSHTMSRDHVPSDTVSEAVNDVQSNLSSSDYLLDANSSTFEIEINSKVQSTTTCFPNEQYNIQETSFDVNLPPHETEIVSSSELDMTPDGLMVKLPSNSNKQLKNHSKAPVPSIVTKNLPTTFIEEEYADDDGCELPRSSLSSPHSTISSTSFSMSVLSTTSTYAESINTVISTSSIQTIDKSIISSSTYSEFKANDDHIADQYFDEIPYKQESGNLCYLSERSMSPEHLSP